MSIPFAALGVLHLAPLHRRIGDPDFEAMRKRMHVEAWTAPKVPATGLP